MFKSKRGELREHWGDLFRQKLLRLDTQMIVQGNHGFVSFNVT